MTKKPTSLARVRNARNMQPEMTRLQVEGDILGLALYADTRGFTLSRDFEAIFLQTQCKMAETTLGELADVCSIDHEAMYAIHYGDGKHIKQPDGEWTEAVKHIAAHLHVEPERLFMPMERVRKIEAAAAKKLKRIDPEKLKRAVKQAMEDGGEYPDDYGEGMDKFLDGLIAKYNAARGESDENSD